MIVKDTLSSYSNDSYTRMYFDDDDVSTSVLINLKHAEVSEETSGQAKIKFYPNRFDRRDQSISFNLSSIDTVRAGYSLSPDSNKIAFAAYPDNDTDNDLVVKEYYLDSLVMAKYYSATASYVWVLVGGFNFEKILVDGTVAELYSAITTTVTFNVNDGGGTDIEDAVVTLTGYGTADSDASGDAFFYSVVDGDIDYDVSATGYVTKTGETVTVSGDTTETVTLVSTQTDFLTYSFAEQTGAATINTTAHTIDIEVANGTDASALVATFTMSYGAGADISDVAQVSATTSNNFSSPVTYTVTAEDTVTEQDWVVTVTVAAV